MAREFAKAFYHSQAWIKTRAAYAKSVGGLCEDCLKEGRITPGKVVHHVVPLTPMNISNPDITLSWDNLKLVCQDCHAKEHASNKGRRYTVDRDGKVTSF